MSTAMVLPRFSDLCKDILLDQESLTLPPLRSFPESFSRHSPPSPVESTSSAGCSSLARHKLSISHLSGNMVYESPSPCYDTPWRSSSYSRDSTPSDDSSVDIESDRQYPQDPLQAILYQSGRQKKKRSDSAQQKPKKVKYHTCEICQKPFPRPSGLRAHMNMHTKEKPFECGFPGCSKRFSVSSNAKRHLRTHGVGLSPADDPSPLPYVVDFEEPVVVGMESDDSSSSGEQMNLKWMPLGAGTRRSYKTRNNHGEAS